MNIERGNTGLRAFSAFPAAAVPQCVGLYRSPLLHHYYILSDVEAKWRICASIQERSLKPSALFLLSSSILLVLSSEGHGSDTDEVHHVGPADCT